MPMAPSKWRNRTEKTATEQRARAKRRVFCRDAKGRFAALAPVLPLPLPDPRVEINQLLNNPIEIRGHQYRVTEVRHETMFDYHPQVTLRMQPVYPQYSTLSTTPYFPNNNFGGTMAYTSQQAWGNWNTSGLTTYSTNYQTIQNPEITWTGWINDLQGLPQQINQEYDRYQQQNAPPPLTPEQQAAERVRMDQARHQQAVAAAERQRVHAIAREAQDVATRRALATFVEVLNPHEREAYEKEKCIYVHSQHGRRYRIKCTKGQSGNVELLSEHGSVTAGFCVHPAYDRTSGMLLPDPDAWITQKLFLEHDEDHFLQVANLTRGVRPERGRLVVPGRALAA